MITLDIDGTLLGYSGSPTVNRPLILSLSTQTRQVSLVTIQGGLPFGILNSAGKYPRPEDFYHRLCNLQQALFEYNIHLAMLRVCIYHPKAPSNAIHNAASQLRNLLSVFCVDWKVYTTERARKPNPFMLRSVGASVYYGDSDEDEQAALAAGIEFVKVERFR